MMTDRRPSTDSPARNLTAALLAGPRWLVTAWPWRALVWCVTGGLTSAVLFVGLFVGLPARLRVPAWGPLLDLEAARLALIDPPASERLRTEIRDVREGRRPLSGRHLAFLALTGIVTGPLGLGLVALLGLVLAVALAAPWLAKPGDPITIGPLLVDSGAPAWTAAGAGLVGLVLTAYLIAGYAVATSQLGSALLADPEALQREVTRLGDTRTGLLHATEAERRRIESELHDRVQHRLVALALNLGLVESQHGDDELGRLAAESHRQVDDVLAELRAVLLGIQPRALTDHGLAAAVTDLVGPYPLPVAVDLGDTEAVGRLPAQVEQVAYLVVSESLTNAAKHAGAMSVAITADHTDDDWWLTVSDDGRGGARPRTGGGLDTLAARVAALDGTLEIVSPDGGPTEIRMRCPKR